MDFIWILKKPIISEKSLFLAKVGKYTFEVDKRATKKEIANAVEKQFGVNAVSVRTINIKPRQKKVGRQRQKTTYVGGAKKAIVQVAKDQKIDLFEVAKK